MPTFPAQAPRGTGRSIALLALAGFASQAMVRVTDSLLPQIAADLGTTVGSAAIVVTAYAITHGSIQLVIGPVGDRFGKYRCVAAACAASALLVMLCGLAQSLPMLALARLMSGAAAGWIIPLSLAYVGDVTPYERRQPVLGRYLSGQISGQIFGQAVGGVLGDMFGWRTVFFLLAALFALATVALVRELIVNAQTHSSTAAGDRSRGFIADYSAVLGGFWARIVIVAVMLEGALVWGTFAYVGADLHLRFGLPLTAIGLIVAAFGLGGLVYSFSVRQLVSRMGQVGLARTGGLVMAAAYLLLTLERVWWFAPLAVLMIGLGFYMLHNTLQTNATQMTPQARGTAVAIFSSAFYLGQTIGVGASSLAVDHYTARPLFLVSAIGIPALAFWFAAMLGRHAARKDALPRV